MNHSMPGLPALSITNPQSSLKLMSIKPVMPSSHLILCHPLFLLLPVLFFLVSLVLPTVPWHRQLWIHILEFTIPWIQAILIPACASSSPEFLMMYSAYKLNKQLDNIEPRYTPFLIWIQSKVSCQVLTIPSWPTYRFLKRQVRWSGIPISLRIFHSVLWSTQSNEAEVDGFLEFCCFSMI